VGQSIPFALYAAVAAILAWLYRRDMEERLRRQQQQEAARARAQDFSTQREEPQGMATQPASQWMREPESPSGVEMQQDPTIDNEENL